MADQKEEIRRCASIVLVVSKQFVKAVKSALERAGRLDRNAKITPKSIDDNERVVESQQRMRIPTTIQHLPIGDGVYQGSSDMELSLIKDQIVGDLDIKHLSPHISLSYQIFSKSRAAPNRKNPICKALEEALDTLPPSTLTDLQLTIETLVSSFPESYSVYKPMLLLTHNAFTSEPWTRLLTVHPPKSEILQSLWKHIASSVDTTHIAINSPIPSQKDGSDDENIIRSPVNLTPIYGNFGPRPTPQTLVNPTPQDFDAALWVSTTQNGIHQTWAPLYTMFSRGNIREKSRILHHPSVTADLDTPSAAVDLYAGIGYFAFSYKNGGARRPSRANGIKTVLCFELNPWSVEGLRRGAEMNGWTYRIFREDDVPETERGWKLWREDIIKQGVRENFWIFQMSNDRALPILQDHLADLLPPIRHVNLGLLPTSRLSWNSASRLVDAQRGGWIRVHENVGIGEIEERTVEVRETFQNMVDEYNEGGKREVDIEHVERVKMYAPGVVHCVFDVCVTGDAAQSRVASDLRFF